MSDNERVKVLYIAGWGRSGSTLLGNILGQQDGFFSVGELRFIWERGLLENRKCGCGQPFLECKMWQKIIHNAYGNDPQIQPLLIEKMAQRYARTRRILWLVATRGGNRKSKDFDEYLQILEDLYLGIARATKCQVIVDSSKFPLRGALVRLIPSIDLYVVHLIRDPRATAYSWMTPKNTADLSVPTFLENINPLSNSLWWIGWNLVSEYIGNLQPDRYLRLNYETFVSNPRDSINEILAFVGEPRSANPFSDERTVFLQESHTIAGNPIRFAQGEVEIKLDMRWISNMKPYHKWMVTLITLPFLSHFGYSDLHL